MSALDSVITSDAVLEFNVPEDNWSEFFVEVTEAQALPPIVALRAPDEDDIAEAEPDPGPQPATEAETGPATATSTGTDTASINYVPEDWQELLNEVPEEADEAPVYRIDADGPEAVPGAAPGSGAAPGTAPPLEAMASENLDEEHEAPADLATAQASGAEPLAESILIGRPFEWQPNPEPPEAPRGRRRAFGLGGAVLALTLVLQPSITSAMILPRGRRCTGP